MHGNRYQCLHSNTVAYTTPKLSDDKLDEGRAQEDNPSAVCCRLPWPSLVSCENPENCLGQFIALQALCILQG